MIPFFNEIARKFLPNRFSGRDGKSPGKTRSRKPRVESLEDRCMLAVLYVDATAESPGTGLSWNAAFPSLQDALDLASSSTEYSEIWIAAGTYAPSRRATAAEARSETFSLVDGVDLYGGFSGTETNKNQRQVDADDSYVHRTILSGDLAGNDDLSEPGTLDDNAYTVLYGYGIESATTVEGLVVTGGNAALSTVHTGTVLAQWTNGGGVFVNACSALVLENLVVSNNISSGAGGGIYVASGELQIDDCVFVDNAATDMGGGVHVASGTVTINSSRFHENDAETTGGGALSQENGVLNVAGTHFSGNTGHYGGGFHQNAGTAHFTNSSFIANVAQDRYAVIGEGGGLYQRGQTHLVNVTFAENVAGYGGAISVINPDAPEVRPESRYTNITVSKNIATENAGGIYLQTGRVTINNSVVAANTAKSGSSPDVYGETRNTLAFSGSYNLLGDGTGLPALPDGSTSLAAIGNGRNGNQVGTATSPKIPRLGAPTEFGSGVFVLPILASDTFVVDKGSASLFPADEVAGDGRGNAQQYPRIVGSGIDLGAVEGTTAIRAAQRYLVESLEDVVREDGVLTFREAMEAANGNVASGDAAAGSFTDTDVITFAEGLSGTMTLGGKTLTLHDSLTITGPGADTLVLDGENRSRIVHVVGNAGIEISAVTLRDGYSRSNGGAMNVTGATLTLKDVTILGGRTTRYGYGGGLYLRDAGTANLTNVVIGDSSAYYGGGAYIDNTRTNIVGASIYDNRAEEEGGGLFQLGGTVQIANATIARNIASRGAGLSIIEGTAVATHVTVTDNVGVYVGGLMLGRSAKLNLRNSVVAENFSYHAPDAYMYLGSAADRSTFSVEYSLIGDDTGMDEATLGAGNIIGTASNPADPEFAFPSMYRGRLIYSLSPTSRVIDAADEALSVDSSRNPLTTDVRGEGYLRISGDEADMGACERQQELRGSISAASHALRLPQTLDMSGTVLVGTASRVTYYWDLNDNGFYGETGDAATQGVETGRNTTFISAGALRRPGEAYKVRLILVDTVTGQMSDPVDWEINIVADAPTYSIDGPREFKAKTTQYWTITARNTVHDPIMNWTVKWGDDTETVFLGGPRNSIEVSHYYRSSGTYYVRIETESLYADKQDFQIATFQVIVGANGSITGYSAIAGESEFFGERPDECSAPWEGSSTFTLRQERADRLMKIANSEFRSVSTHSLIVDSFGNSRVLSGPELSGSKIVEGETDPPLEILSGTVFPERYVASAVATDVLPMALAGVYDETVDSRRGRSDAVSGNVAPSAIDATDTETRAARTWENLSRAKINEADLALLRWIGWDESLETDIAEEM